MKVRFAPRVLVLLLGLSNFRYSRDMSLIKWISLRSSMMMDPAFFSIILLGVEKYVGDTTNG
eukprot:scaffold10250_cov145-Amphora_coffeaeformis.AAC.2